MGGDSISSWRTGDYSRLSSQLGRQTKVYLSENTLKRIFGRLKTSQRYYPQKATRDALAQFVGYRDWREFEVANSRRTLSAEPPLPILEEPLLAEEKSQSPDRKRNPVFPYYYSVGALLLIVCIAFVLWPDGTIYQPHSVKLICDNPKGYVPHSAAFRLNEQSRSDEDFVVDFWDEAQPAHLKKGASVTRFFRNPGVVYATLLYKGKPIDTTSVLLQTRGWVANSGNDTSNAFPINNLRPLDTANIYVSPAQLDSAGLNLSRRFLVGFSNIRPSGISGDNFDFKCRVYAEQSRAGMQCVETTIIILGEKHRHLLKLFRASCVAFSEYKFSENYVSGADKFLGRLAFNPEQGGDIELKINNKKVLVFLNGKQALKTSYKRSIGKVLGVKVLFSGIGRVVSPKLVDLSTAEVF